jgi:P4 family phage/plasmid primase-like protien
MVMIKLLDNTEKSKKGEIINYSKKGANYLVSIGVAEYITEPKKQKIKKIKVKKKELTLPIKEDVKPIIKKEIPEPLSKQILDRWATLVVDENGIWVNKEDVSQVNQDKIRNYEEEGYKGTEVLWIAPKDSLVFEFEDTPERNKRYIAECESVAKSLQWDYCITGHEGKSDYFRMFNIEDLPMGNDNKNAKLLLFDMLLPSSAKNQLDRTNLGWTLSPVIQHPHWKKKYNGSIHQILRGKNPLEHKNKLPQKIITALKKSKIQNKKHNEHIILNSAWVEDFLINYCCNNLLPSGARHFVIEKNLSAFILHRDDKDEIKKKYFEAQNRKHDSLRTWEIKQLHGEYIDCSAGEIANFIKEYNIPYKIQTTRTDLSVNINKTALSLFVTNKDELAQDFYNIQPYFFDNIGFFWVWNYNSCCYDRKDEYELMNEIKNVAAEKYFQMSESKFWNETLRSLKLIGTKYRPLSFEKSWIQFNKTIYDYKTGDCIKPSPQYFNTNPIPYEVGDSDQTPNIDKLFVEWVSEKNLITLKETIALSLLQDYPLHRIVCLFGSGCNGKGVFLRFLNKFLGSRNLCSSNLKKLMSGNFETSKLYQKLACIISETDFNVIRDTSILKQLSGQDLISAEFKGKNSFDYQNYSTLFIASNSMPITEDRTDGFYRRWLIIDFPFKFKEGNDPLERVPEIEYNNFALQLLKLLPELIKRGRFDNDGEIEERKKKYEEKSNPLSTFFKENYEYDIQAEVPFFELYDKYCIFSQQHGFREISKKAVSTLLENMFNLETEKKDIKIGNEWKKWVYVIGIRKKHTNIEKTTKNSEISNSSYRSNSTSNQTLYRDLSEPRVRTVRTVRNEFIEEKINEETPKQILTYETFQQDIKQHLSKQPIMVEVFKKRCENKYDEDRFEHFLTKAKECGDVYEQIPGYIQKL